MAAEYAIKPMISPVLANISPDPFEASCRLNDLPCGFDHGREVDRSDTTSALSRKATRKRCRSSANI
jgi:hypothetical protein